MARNSSPGLSMRHSDSDQFTHIRLPRDLYNAIKRLALEMDCNYQQCLRRLVEQEIRDQRVRDYLRRREQRTGRFTYTEGQQINLLDLFTKDSEKH